MTKLLSIVVPAYNMEQYLERCLDSLCVEEIMDRVEVIIVNDGSKDRTLDIARCYELKHPNFFIVLDKENGNYGSCMNVGLSRAKGKYFRSLDADDWFVTERFVSFIDDLEKTDADLILSEREDFFERNNSYSTNRFAGQLPYYQDLEISPALWDNETIRQALTVTRMCYKTAILRKSKLKWTEGVYYSDTEFDYWPLRFVLKIRIIPIPYYVYLIGRSGQSISQQSIRNNFKSFYAVSYSILEDFLLNADPNSAVYHAQKQLLKQVSRFMYQSLLFDGFKNIKEIRRFEGLLKKNRTLYQEFGLIDTYRDIKYVREFRASNFRLCLIRLDYLVRSNPFLRKVLRFN